MTEQERLDLFLKVIEHGPNEVVSLALPMLAHAIVQASAGDKHLLIRNYSHVGNILSECLSFLFKLQEQKLTEAQAKKQVDEFFKSMGVKLQ